MHCKFNIIKIGVKHKHPNGSCHQQKNNNNNILIEKKMENSPEINVLREWTHNDKE